MLNYVVNVIEDAAERARTLRRSWDLCRGVLVVAARLATDARGLEGVEWLDGLITRLGTFQKLYQQAELRSWIEVELGTKPVAASPGVFYIFRDDARAQAFIASRFRRRIAAPRVRVSDVIYEQHRESFEALSGFLAERGRLPRPEELAAAARLAQEVGSLPRAVAVLRRVTGTQQWDEVVRTRIRDLMVYIALSRFGGRPKAGQLPAELRYDIQDFFGSYAAACREADALLESLVDARVIDMACATSSIGKLTPSALYVHSSAVASLDPVLRVYEGCGRVLAGVVDGATVVKLHRGKPQVSYLAYPDFDEDPHPALAFVAKVRLGKVSTEFVDYRGYSNPPILHRKELFVLDDYPRRRAFASLTAAEEKHGLYSTTAAIGHRDQWNEVLKAHGVQCRGHRLIRSPKTH